MATFLELQDQVLRHLREVTAGTRVMVKDSIRWTLYDLADRGDFPWWHGEAQFATDSFYATGRASAKVDSRIISGSATAWSRFVPDAVMVFSASAPGRTANRYRIENRVSKTKLNLKAQFRGANVTRKKYALFRDEYRLRYDVDRILRIRYPKSPDKLVDFWPRELYDYNPNPTQVGDPTIYRNVGVTERAYYSTRSASFVANSKTVTGSGTSWDARMIGMQLRNANDGRYYEIGSVPSGTSLRITEAYTGSNTGKKKYEIGPAGTPLIQLYPIPYQKYPLVYEYQRIPKLPYANADVPDLPIKHHEILVWGALMRCHMQGAIVDEKVLEMARSLYQQFTPEKMAAKSKLSNDRIQRMGSWDTGRRYSSGRLDPSRWRYPR